MIYGEQEQTTIPLHEFTRLNSNLIQTEETFSGTTPNRVCLFQETKTGDTQERHDRQSEVMTGIVMSIILTSIEEISQ
jgi:hypothetical protein